MIAYLIGAYLLNWQILMISDIIHTLGMYILVYLYRDFPILEQCRLLSNHLDNIFILLTSIFWKLSSRFYAQIRVLFYFYIGKQDRYSNWTILKWSKSTEEEVKVTSNLIMWLIMKSYIRKSLFNRIKHTYTNFHDDLLNDKVDVLQNRVLIITTLWRA